MKFNVASKAFQQKLSAVGRVILAKSPLTILENFLFTLDGDRLIVKGSDQENVMTASMEVFEAEGSGSVAVPAKRLLDILKELPDVGLTVDINEESMGVTLGFEGGQLEFMALPGNEYPTPKQRSDDSLTITFGAGHMLTGLENTLYAASTDPIRPVMTGVCMDFKPETSLVFVASDTHKLVKYEVSSIKPAFERRFILPPKAANLLRSLLDKEEGDITITMDAHGATFTWGDFELQCVFITGNFPPYDRVIPQNNPFELTFDRELMLSAMRRMSLVANSGSRLVRLALTPECTEITARDIDYARSGHERVMSTYQGNPMSIGFNCEYMVEVLSNFTSDEVSMHLSDPSRPAIFARPASEDTDAGEKLIVLMMTMQLID